MTEFFEMWAKAFDGLCRFIGDSLGDLFKLS